jgi:hypothetical protein
VPLREQLSKHRPLLRLNLHFSTILT